ncbi:MAG TPA: hypothetical protein VGN42_06105 [Pirellulales bacterium]|jgi:hypothetical protein|nr:hypothetical protein [Pirellulales bacterium]
MAAKDVQLISRQGTSPPTAVSLEVGAIAVNLSFIDRRLKKAGRPELRSIFEADDGAWLPVGDVLGVLEDTGEFFSDPAFDDLLFEVVVEQLGPAIDALRALPKNSVIRLEVTKSAPRKLAKAKPARTASSGQAAASSRVKKKPPKHAAGATARGTTDTSLQLTTKQREYIQSLLERYRCDADLWAFPDLERKARLSGIDPYSGLNNLDCLRRNLRQQQPQLSDEECEAMVEMNLLSTDLLERGVARRIAFNMLSDLRAALSLPARMSLRGALRAGGGGGYTDAWNLLATLAAKDIAVVRRFFEVNNTPLKGPGNRSAILIYNALLAIVTQNEAQQRALLAPLAEQRKPIAVTQPVHTVLGGIISNNSSAVAAGLAQVMKNFRRFTYLFDEGKIICFEAHGLAELALEMNSSLLDTFDVAQGLPWDAAYFEWLRGESSSPVYPELAKKSPLLDKWLNCLEVSD